jgi:hypothetical protein
MHGSAKSLAELVREAHRLCVPPWRKQTWEEGSWFEDQEELDDFLFETIEMADGVVKAAEGGDFFRAVDRMYGLLDELDWRGGIRGEYWTPLLEVCKLVEQVDCFLATLDQAAPTAALARGCRHNFFALLMLADCCDENGRPGAAAEARYLYARLREIDS